jgi:hypothetical protein
LGAPERISWTAAWPPIAKTGVAADGNKRKSHLDHIFGVSRRAAMDAGLNLVPLAAIEHFFNAVIIHSSGLSPPGA